jgi:hypothetical protein
MDAEKTFDEKTAYHEAAHAVADCIVGLRLVSVTIVPRGSVLGETITDDEVPPEWNTYFHDSPGKRDNIRAHILTKLAGAITVQHKFPDHELDEGDRRDENSARNFLARVSWEDQEQYFERSRQDARELVLTNWTWIEAVAVALMKRGTLTGDDVLALRPSRVQF